MAFGCDLFEFPRSWPRFSDLGATVRCGLLFQPGVYGGDFWQILTQPANIPEQVEVPEREEVVG